MLSPLARAKPSQDLTELSDLRGKGSGAAAAAAGTVAAREGGAVTGEVSKNKTAVVEVSWPNIKSKP